MESLSLYHIETDLLQLLEYREERQADTTEPASEEELKAIDGEIQKCMEQLPAKVEGVAGIVRMWRATASQAKSERDRYARIVSAIEAREKRLLAYAADVMILLPEPAKGCRKLMGRDGSQLLLKGNGGIQPLAVDEAMLPDDFRDVTVVMPLTKWNSVSPTLPNCRITQTAPGNARIREAIARGEGVPGAHLEPRGQHVEVK